MPSRKRRAVKRRTRPRKPSSNLGYVIDAYRGKLPVIQIGEAGEGELAFKISRSGDPVSDWRDESEVVSVHLTAEGKKEASRVKRLME